MIEPRYYLHRAPWVLPLAEDLPAVIADGAVLTEEGRIVRVAPYAELRDSEATLVEHRGKVLLPPLINCHTHLELSHLARLGRGEAGTGAMTGWIRRLLAERARPVDPEEVRMAAWQALAQLYAGGCRAVLDIGNDPGSAGIGANFKVEVRFFLEFFGLTAVRAAEQAVTLAALPETQAGAGHAPYSTHPELLKLLKERAGRAGQLLPIHLAESAEELEFLASGRGPLREFLEERGAWDGSFFAPGLSPVAYLADLGLLDDRTLAVHCVQVDDHDIALLARSGATVCLCPVSNRFLGVGRAPVPALLTAGVPLVLGSDSLASNPALDLWAEMRQLSEDHPGLPPLAILRMATANGARLLGLEKECGALAPGGSAAFLAASVDLPPEANGAELPARLVAAGRPASLEWVEAT
jgi:cytosine/adenosine deaminase-related metal-dependent hydrolase